MNNPLPLPNLHDSDLLGRGVYSRNRARKWRNSKKDHGSFNDGDEISVDRLGHASDDDMAQIQVEAGRQRGSNKFFGWAVLPVQMANKKGSRAVVPDPIDEPAFKNPYHALIKLLLADGADRSDEQLAHAVELASKAIWKPSPLI